jgi:hypothetical protein
MKEGSWSAALAIPHGPAASEAEASFRPFLKLTGRGDLLDALALARARRHHDMVPLLESGVEQKVVDASRQGKVSSGRHNHWRGSTIGLVQQKTGNR